jgi:hypothetical protein
MAAYDAQYWQNQIKLSSKELENFHSAGRQVVGHYLDEGSVSLPAEGLGAHKINMFWANVGILKSALYGNPPKPTAMREFADPEDDVARVAAQIMERLLKTSTNGTGADMNNAFTHAVEDRLIPGMGQVWLRYDANITEMEVMGISTKQIEDESVPCDYVYWQDFFYSPCRVWEECYWVARRVWMKPVDLKRRFPDFEARIPLKIPKDGGSYEANSSEENSTLKRGEIYEIWCKTTRKVHWVAKGLDEMLDEQPDPLELQNFFPCPRPLVSNTTTTKFIGRADYTMVQDQYSQLNNINIRLGYLIDACKAVGVYDKQADGVQRMLNQATENQLIPIDNWAMFAEKGGIKGVVDWLPIEAVVAVIEKLRESRVDTVQQIYELTGISDIMRGVTNARETYGAQQLKAQYSSSRLQLYQMQVGSFVAEVMDIKAGIISKHFQPETIIKKSLVQYTPDAPYADAAVKLIKDSWQLMYRINVSSTQMSIPDYNAEKQARQEFVTNMGQFVSQVEPMVSKSPSAAPFMLKILQWAGAAFATSGGVETLFDNYIRAVEKQIAQPPQSPPDPAVIKAQADLQKTQIQIQSDQGLAQLDAQTKQMLAKLDAEVRAQIAKIDNDTKERIAAAQIEADLHIAEIKQGELFTEEARDLDDRERDLKLERQSQDLRTEAADLQIKSIVDAALQEVQKLADDHELKVKESLLKAQVDTEKKEAKAEVETSKSETSSMQKMHADLMQTVAEVAKGLQSLAGKRSISITLPDGGKASAEVTPKGNDS